MTADISFQDYLEIHNLAWNWAESYDHKDWERLQTVLAPSINLDFRSLKGELHENLTPQGYADILSSRPLLGDKELKTQHLLGGSNMTREADGIIKVEYQVRVAHRRFKDETLTEEVNKGHGIGAVLHKYKKVNGEWKICYVASRLEWAEYDLFGTLAPPEK